MVYFVLGVVMIVIGGALGAVGAYFAKDGWEEIKEARKAPPKPSAEAIKRFVVDRRVVRKEHSGDVVVTPVAMFKDTHTYDGKPSEDTFILCRFTNSGSRAVTIGSVESGDPFDPVEASKWGETEKRRVWYRIDDLGLGYQPTTTALAQYQMFFRGEAIDEMARRKKAQGTYEPPDKDTIEAATLKPGETKYGYVNSLGRPWRAVTTFVVIGATDTEIGRVTLEIQ